MTTSQTMNVRHLDEVELVSYEVLKSSAAGIVGTLTRYFSKHPELEKLPEWQAREAAGIELWREVDVAYDDFVNAADPMAAMRPYFDRIKALRIEGEVY